MYNYIVIKATTVTITTTSITIRQLLTINRQLGHLRHLPSRHVGHHTLVLALIRRHHVGNHQH